MTPLVAQYRAWLGRRPATLRSASEFCRARSLPGKSFGELAELVAPVYLARIRFEHARERGAKRRSERAA